MDILKYESTYNYNSSDYLSLKILNVNIPFDSLDPINVISYNCENSITNWSVLKNCVQINITLCFKVLYTINSSKTLNVIKYNTHCYEVIQLPTKIDGFNFNSIDIRKKLHPSCDVTNLCFLGCTNFTLCFSIIINSIIKIILSPSIIYKIDSPSVGSYLYYSDSLGKSFTQLNFSPKIYKHICFSLYDNSFFYFESNTIFSYDLLTKQTTSLLLDNFLDWFYNISPTKFIICRNMEDTFTIYISSLCSADETLIYKSEINSKCFSFVFTSNILGFILSSSNSQCLILLNIYGDILLNINCDFDRLFINYDATFALICSDSTIQVVDVINKSFEFIKIPINDFLLNHIVFLYNDLAIFCGSSNSTNYIFSLNVKTLCFTELFKCNFNISHIDVTSSGQILFSSNILGLYNIYSFTLGSTPNILVKLFSNNLSLLIRK